MRRRTMCSVAAAIWSLGAGVSARHASAQGWPPDAPTFATMDRQDGSSFIGAQLGFTFLDQVALDGPDAPDATGLRLDLYGQYVSRSRLGVYAALPLSHVILEDFEDESAIGNVEAGAIYIVRTGPGTELVLHGGITLPTADDGPGADISKVVTNFISTWPRLTDIAHAWPHALWVRLGVSPIIQRGYLILRADAGVDAALSSDDDFDDPSAIVRLNVGGGVDTGRVAVLGELVTLANAEDEAGEDLVHTLALSARFRAGGIEPGLAIGVPLDDSVRDFIDLFVIAGLQGRI
ncbi:MAG TPA: hypothetical protein VKB80_03920 [Kofleriaceae bacterium]|nr:hypothetical protein [Kofleriaceae bacterium]